MLTGQIFSAAEEKGEWFDRFKKGDPLAYSYIYKRLWTLLCFHASKKIQDSFVVQTIVQDSFHKGLELRDRITNLNHLYRFIRLNLKWGIAAYYTDNRAQFYRSFIHAEDFESYIGAKDFYFEENEDTHVFDEERVNMIYEVIPFLPLNKRMVLLLHFKYGITHKQIGNRYNKSTGAVNHQVRDSLDYLKRMIHSSKKLDHLPLVKSSVDDVYDDSMSPEMRTIFKFRYEMKMGFDAIANKMNLELPYIHKQYIAAHKIIESLKFANNGRSQNEYCSKNKALR